MTKSARVILVYEDISGHRPEYLRLFRDLIERTGGTVEQRGLRASDALRRGPLFSTMLEEHPIRFGIVALTRSLLGRRSVSLVFRLAEVAHGRSWRMRAKRWMLRVLKRARHAHVISILPTTLDPAFPEIVETWIYDPQLWDEPSIALPASHPAVLEHAGGRRVICALGALNHEKAFDRFCDIWLESEEVRQSFLFVAAGRVAPGLKDRARAFARTGGLLADGFVSDNDLRAYYNAADMIWCYYSPDYNQASGIFGRAAQFGRRPLVRAGSHLAGLSQSLGIASLQLDGDIEANVGILLQSGPERIMPVDRTELRETSVRRLSRCLGIGQL